MRALPLLLLLAAALSAEDFRVQYSRLLPGLIQQRLESVTRKLSDRRATLESLFREAGCSGQSFTTQKVPGSPVPNLICTLPGMEPDAGTIVVGGHYDLAERGMGAVDDWSGAVLLPSLYESLKNTPRRHSYVFIAFAAEEVGLRGSKEYVRALSKSERAQIQAMINLECLGMAPAKVWATRADKQLLSAYAVVAQSMKLPLEASNVDNVGDDDSHSFLDAKIPVLTMHSTTSANIGLLHSTKDQVSAIIPAEYYDAYRLAATFLATLDSLQPRSTE